MFKNACSVTIKKVGNQSLSLKLVFYALKHIQLSRNIVRTIQQSALQVRKDALGVVCLVIDLGLYLEDLVELEMVDFNVIVGMDWCNDSRVPPRRNTAY